MAIKYILKAKERNNSLVGIAYDNRSIEDLLDEVYESTGDEYYVESSEALDDGDIVDCDICVF